MMVVGFSMTIYYLQLLVKRIVASPLLVVVLVIYNHAICLKLSLIESLI